MGNLTKSNYCPAIVAPQIEAICTTLLSLQSLGVERVVLSHEQDEEGSHPQIMWSPQHLDFPRVFLQQFWQNLNEPGGPPTNITIDLKAGTILLSESMQGHHWRRDDTTFDLEGQHLSHTEGRWEA